MLIRGSSQIPRDSPRWYPHKSHCRPCVQDLSLHPRSHLLRLACICRKESASSPNSSWSIRNFLFQISAQFVPPMLKSTYRWEKEFVFSGCLTSITLSQRPLKNKTQRHCCTGGRVFHCCVLNFRALSAAVTMMASTPLTAASCSSFVYCSTSSWLLPTNYYLQNRRPDWDQASTIARIFFILSVIGAVYLPYFLDVSDNLLHICPDLR